MENMEKWIDNYQKLAKIAKLISGKVDFRTWNNSIHIV